MRLLPPRPPPLTRPFTHSPHPHSALGRARELGRPQRPRGLIGYRSTAPYAREKTRTRPQGRGVQLKIGRRGDGILRRILKWGNDWASLPFSCELLSIPTVSKQKSSELKGSYICVLEELKSKQLPSRIRKPPPRKCGTVKTGF